jgi:outer membrane protein OmpA-like peptidoglycan-associated protein
MSFLKQQKATLGVLMPDALSARFSSASEGVDMSTLRESPSRSWIGVALIALVAILAGLWVFNRNQAASSSAATTAAIDTSAPSIADSEMVPASEALPQTLDTLESFLAAPVASELPKRFRFENLHFESGTTTLLQGSDAEVTQIATALMAHPQARARLEAFTDNVGEPQANQALSQQRAEAVRDQLIARGVAADQVQALGLGDQNPVASNESEAGRALNRRIEFVITEAQ